MRAVETLKKNLLKMREELLKEISDSRKSVRDPSDRDVGDFYDDAENEKGRQMTYLLGERERSKLNAIDTALERIEEGEYGICDECGEKINPKRLKIIPFTRFCVKCQSEMEKLGIQPEDSIEDKLLYKDVSLNDIEGIEN